jgi:chromosome segregation ATPase
MGELVLEKLIQKVSNMLEEIGDVNILVRRMTPTQETLNRINERVDAVLAALKQLEKGVQLDEQKLAQLEEQISLLKEGLESDKNMAEELVSSFKGTALGMNATVEGLETKVNRSGEFVTELGKKSDLIRERLDRLDHEEYARWHDNGKLLDELQKGLVDLKVTGIVMVKRLVDLKVTGIILIVLVVMVLSILLFR